MFTCQVQAVEKEWIHYKRFLFLRVINHVLHISRRKVAILNHTASCSCNATIQHDVVK